MGSNLDENAWDWYKTHDFGEVRTWSDIRAQETEDLIRTLQQYRMDTDTEYLGGHWLMEKPLLDELSIRHQLGEHATQQRKLIVRARLEGAHLKAVTVALRLIHKMSIDEIVEITELERACVEAIAVQVSPKK